MKFNQINIKPHKDQWEITHYSIPGDRIGKPKPNALGFYYYPETETMEEAFNKLKMLMIKRHNQEVFRLQKSLKKLTKLEFPAK